MLTDSNSINQLHQQYTALCTFNKNLVVTKSILSICLLFHILGMITPVTSNEYVSLISFNLFNKYYLWTLITAAMYDTRIIAACVTVLIFPLLSSYCERTHGSVYTLLLIIITAILSNITMAISMIIMFASTEIESYIYNARYGTAAVLASLIMCMRHDKPDTSVIPNISILKYRHLPPVLCVVSILIYVITGLFATECILLVSGTYISWLYLRFYAYDPSTTYTGDLTNEFSYSALYPNVPQIRVIIDIIAASAYHTFKTCGLFNASIRSQQQREQSALNADSNSDTTRSGTSLSTSVNADIYNFRQVDKVAEQRRIAAIKRIDDKLAELAKSKPEADDDFTIDIDTDNTMLPDTATDNKQLTDSKHQ